jgi:putative tricarboxylic transport membrane protein
VRPYQVGTAAVIALIAAVAMFDSRDIFAGSRGTSPGDVGAHFYPFWAAALMGIAAVAVAYRAVTTPQAAEGVFTGRTSVLAVLKLVIPMVVAATAMLWLGMYIVTALYMGLYARWLGRYNWIWVTVIAIAFPLTIYLAFEIGFRATLPKSIFYSSGLPF